MALPFKDGQTAEYDSLNQLVGLAFLAACQNRFAIIYDSDVTEFNTQMADGWIAGFECIESTADYDSGTATCEFHDKVGVFSATDLDDFGDASIDGTIWSTTTAGAGTCTEHDGVLDLNSPGNAANAVTATADQASAPDLKSANCTVLIDFTTISDPGNSVTKLQITDGSNTVDVISNLQNQGISDGSMVEVYVNTSTEIANYRVKTAKSSAWGAWNADVDLSSASGSNWYLRFRTEGDPGAANDGVLEVEEVWYVQGTVTKVFQSNGYDHYTTGTNHPGTEIDLAKAICAANYEDNGGTITWYISTDDGSNFTEVTHLELSTIDTAAGKLVLKGSMATATDRPIFLYEFGVKAWE